MMNTQLGRVVFVIMFAFISVNTCFAQTPRQYTTNYNGWFVYTGNHKLTDKWGLHLEMQWRRSNIILDNQQLLLRGGINYYLHPQVYLTAGYCYALTYPYGKFAAKCMFPENRIWEQINFKTSVGAVEVINRLRLEQRSINSPVLQEDGAYTPGDAIYTNRARALLRFSIPFKGKTIEDRSLYASAFNEVYINFGKNVGYNIFDQNRAYVGIGYKLPKVGRLELGYLNQLIFRGDGIKVERSHTLQISLSSNIEFRKKKE
ncbi:MAG TPA: DUF2490 domain-containing protein [Bacteroidia bacterium]|jgi:hypothetical protein|nr:DUF2490 domain-containing protein [Bacteroidia bacterium]